jgi:hypothetical protein
MPPGAQTIGLVNPEEVAYEARDEEASDEAVARLRELLQSWETVGAGSLSFIALFWVRS